MDNIINLKKQIQFPSFMTRLFASFLDFTFISIFLTPLFDITNKFFYDKEKITNLFISNQIQNNINIEFLYDILISQNVMYCMIFQYVTVLVLLVFVWSYFSTSPGKRVFSLIIVDRNSLRKPTIKQSLLRFISYIVSVIPFCIGIFWICFNKDRQSWHDKIANTIVIKK